MQKNRKTRDIENNNCDFTKKRKVLLCFLTENPEKLEQLVFVKLKLKSTTLIFFTAALEVTKGNEIPQSLRDKSQAVITAGGPDSITKMIQELPELLTRNTEILEECERLLREEKESDTQLRDQFKDKWTRTASDKLTSGFEGNAQKYRTIINNAKDADKVVKEKFENHREFIGLLAQGANNMEANLPAGSNQVKSGPTATKLKSLCEDIGNFSVKLCLYSRILTIFFCFQKL